MKKIFLIAAAVIGLFSTGFAQFTYGPKMGVNMSKFSGDRLMPGFQAGAFLNGEFYDRIGVQADFLWTIKGSRHVAVDSITTITTSTVTGLPIPSTTTVNVISTKYYRFIDVPICVYFPISEHIRGFVGPQISVFRHGTQTVTAGSSPLVRSDITGLKGKTSLCIGFDFKFNSPIVVGVRFVGNKFTGGSGGTADAKGQTLNSFMVNVGYRMNW